MKRTEASLLGQLIEEVIATFRQLRVTSARIHGEGAPMPGQRGLLVDLDRLGAQTVANMARARGVSRQHVQVLVDRFRERGILELAENPRHRRSKLVRLTRRGKEAVQAMARREAAALRSLDFVLPRAETLRTLRVLRTLRHKLQDDPTVCRETKEFARKKRP